MYHDPRSLRPHLDGRVVTAERVRSPVPQPVQQPTPISNGLTPELGGFENALLYALGARP